jgi:hypothetical protein
VEALANKKSRTGGYPRDETTHIAFHTHTACGGGADGRRHAVILWINGLCRRSGGRNHTAGIAARRHAALPPPAEDQSAELYPAEVQTVETDNERQIIKSYILMPGQSPANIPRESFERDGFRYALTDITEQRTRVADTKNHTEIISIHTESKDLNAVIQQLSPTLEHQSEDGYAGILSLDLSSVQCAAAGTKSSGYTVSTTREYPRLSSNDTSFIPKTVTENGKTLTLTDITWEAQNTVNLDYEDIPESYRAIAKYTGSGTKTVVTGYVTTAEYTGEITKAIVGDIVYTAYFSAVEFHPDTPEPDQTGAPSRNGHPIDVTPLMLAVLGLAALLGGFTAFFFLRRNVRIYTVGDGRRALTAKARIGKKNLLIDLSPLEGRSESRRFEVEIEKFTAKNLNGKTVEIRYGPASLKHKIAYEGNVYKIDANFHTGTIQAVY